MRLLRGAMLEVFSGLRGATEPVDGERKKKKRKVAVEVSKE
jgi:hypothetical protein